MRNVKFSVLIDKSIDRMTLILFEPFRSKKWLRLIVIAFLAGALGMGGNGGGGGGAPAQVGQSRGTPGAASQTPAPAAEEKKTGTGTAAGGAGNLPGGIVREPGKNAALIALFGVLALAAVVLVLFYIWIVSRFKFIWFDAVVRNDAAIRAPFKKYRIQGNSFFAASLVIAAVTLLYFGLMLGWAAWAAKGAGVFAGGFQWSFRAAARIFAPPGIGAAAGFLALVIVGTVIEDFVVAIMGESGERFLPAWDRFVSVYRQNRRDLLIYLAVKAGLSIVSMILRFILMILWLLAAAAAAAVLIGLPYLALVSWLKTPALFAVVAVLAGIPLILLVAVALFALGLPFAVFFRAFSLYFLSSLGSGPAPLPVEETPA